MELIVLIGIPATGKTTFAQSVLGHSHLRLSLDVLGTRHREQTILACALSMRTKIVVDNTNVTRADRANYIKLAKAAGYTIKGCYFSSRREEAQARNARRPSSERVPRAGVGDKSKRLEHPSLDEGFDELSYVRLAADGFEEEAWIE